MDKKEFTVVCREIFAHYGFLKRKNLYFRAGNNGVLCGLGLKFSQFGPTGSVMVYYYTGAQVIDEATKYNYDFVGYVEVLSKITDKGKSFLTGSIDYERYAKEELRTCLEKAMTAHILPALEDLTFFLQTAMQLRVHHTKDKVSILNTLLAAQPEEAGWKNTNLLGVRRGTVILQPHDPCWPILADEFIEQLKALLGPVAIDIQHVGSTAIKGIHAKPILDIAIGVAALEDIQKYIPILAQHNIIYRGQDQPGQLLFVKGDFERDTRTHHIHVVLYGGVEWENYLNFRDYLNHESEKVEEYDGLKMYLAQQYPQDRSAYTAGKVELVSRILAEAKVWRRERNP